MRNCIFHKRVPWKEDQWSQDWYWGLLVLGVPPAQAQSSSISGIDVINLFCGIDQVDADFDVVALSSTDSCVSNNVSLHE